VLVKKTILPQQAYLLAVDFLNSKTSTHWALLSFLHFHKVDIDRATFLFKVICIRKGTKHCLPEKISPSLDFSVPSYLVLLELLVQNMESTLFWLVDCRGENFSLDVSMETAQHNVNNRYAAAGEAGMADFCVASLTIGENIVVMPLQRFSQPRLELFAILLRSCFLVTNRCPAGSTATYISGVFSHFRCWTHVKFDFPEKMLWWNWACRCARTARRWECFLRRERPTSSTWMKILSCRNACFITSRTA